MNKIPNCILVAILLLGLGAGSAPSLRVAGTVRVNTLTVAGDGAPTYLLEENFEATGYDVSGWSENITGTVDEDYSTTGLGLQGSQALRVDSTTGENYAYRSFTTDECYGYYQIRLVSLDAGSYGYEHFSLTEVGVTHAMRVVADPSAGWRVLQGSVAGGESGTVTMGTTYHVWWYFKASTGANDGIARIWVSTTTTKPGTATSEVTTGNNTGTHDQLWLKSRGDMENVIDRVLIDDVAIGDAP